MRWRRASTLILKDVTHTTGSCVVSGRTMFLVSLNTGSSYQTVPVKERSIDENYAETSELAARDCTVDGCSDVFKVLPGFDKLESWPLSKDDIIRSVWATYEANGYKN